MVFPSLLCLNEVQKRLALPLDGFNATLATVTEEYNADAPRGPIDCFEIDFSPTSTNYWFGDFSLSDIEASGNVSLPAIVIYDSGADEGTRPFVKFSTFSGTVAVNIDVYLSWIKSAPPADGIGPAVCVQAALINLFNRDGMFADDTQHFQFWGQNVAYNGNIGVRPTPISLGDKNWSQLVRAVLTFEVDAP